MSIEKEVKAEMEQSIEHLNKELKSLRTSKANPAVLDSVRVEVYGASMRLKDVANVTAPEARQLLVSPFDANNAGAIANAINNANLSLQAVSDGGMVRINIPPMDESIRKNTAKQCKKKGEEAKVSIRETRRKFNDKVRKLKTDGDIAEDQMKRDEKIIQENTDLFCKQIDDLCAQKEKEILEI